jgi:GxxExxY protein
MTRITTHRSDENLPRRPLAWARAYRADIIVNDAVIVEVKAGETLPIGSKAQTINYVRLSGLEVGLLLYFGPSPEFYRVVSSRSRKDGK